MVTGVLAASEVCEGVLVGVGGALSEKLWTESAHKNRYQIQGQLLSLCRGLTGGDDGQDGTHSAVDDVIDGKDRVRGSPVTLVGRCHLRR